ncbi:MAG TPA: tetratricopeptide repeat protein [Polyangiales bacterium]|nr:tetratricopeptide repeat protein [Polyangiales bacterium]
MSEGTLSPAARGVMCILVCVSASIARTHGGVASAEEAQTPTTTLQYEQALDAAVDEYERGNYQEAREHFRAAHELYPNARTLRGIGKVEFELRNYGEAVRFLSDALAANERALSEPLRHEVEALLERARAYVGDVHVQVQPGSATVIVDGVTVASGPQAELNLLVGDHVLEFRALGRLPERRQISVRGRDQIAVQVTLNALESEHTSANPAAPRSDAKPLYKKPWLWVATGVAAAGVVVAAVLATRDHEGRPSGGTSGLVLGNP